ncbi:MAG: uroporphyrinogen-III synthase [Verrucomicrobiota bacterium]
MSDSLPFTGKRIVITRNTESAGRFSARLRELGAEVLELPLIRVRMGADPQRTADIFTEIAQYEWVVFTSANGVRGFFDEFTRAFEDIRSLGLMRIATVGETTAAAVREWHLKVDLTPNEATAEGLGEALKAEQTLDNLRILVVTGNRNRDVLVKMLEEERAIVDMYPVYQTELADLATDPRAADFRTKGADALVFASSSAVESFGRQAHHLKLAQGAQVPALCSFGPQTSATMKKAGIPIAVEAAEPTLDHMVNALRTHFGV